MLLKKYREESMEKPVDTVLSPTLFFFLLRQHHASRRCSVFSVTLW